MLNDLDRNILKYIIEESVVNGKTLSARCNVSVNTIRKEIAIINDEIEKHGLMIDAKSYVGYKLKYTDEETANKFIAGFNKNSKLYSYMKSSSLDKTNYLIRKFLASSTYVTMESLCEDLFCSKSTLLREIKKVNVSLESFDLKLRTVRNRGIVLEGSEINRRICMIIQYRSYRMIPEKYRSLETRFYNLFMEGSLFHTQLKRCFMEVKKKFPEGRHFVRKLSPFGFCNQPE